MPRSICRASPACSASSSSARPTYPSRRNWKTRRSEEHTSELQSQSNLVCRLLLEKKKEKQRQLSGEPKSGAGGEHRCGGATENTCPSLGSSAGITQPSLRDIYAPPCAVHSDAPSV